jgi:uncharacterized membrane protein (DUF2068 family)
MSAGRQREVGLQLVITYKFVKAVVELALGLLLGGLTLYKHGDGIEHWAHALSQHVTNAAAVHLARFLLRVGTPFHLMLGSLALIFDGAFSAFEGWALHKRRWWAPWLVVIATSVFIPYEVHELIHHHRLTRVLLLVANVAVVVYLVGRAIVEHERYVKESRTTPP